MTITLTVVQKVLVGILALLLVVVLVLGVRRGQRLAQADFVLHQVAVTQQGLQYFYNDQSRFPTMSEYADPNSMVRYFSTSATPEPSVTGCANPLVQYANDSQKTYQLTFCLPVARGQYPAGVSTISQRLP